MGRFNHAIVRVDATAKDPAMWVDPTDDFAHAGDLPSQDQGRLALVAAGDTSGLTKTPETPSTANKYAETRIYTLPEDGKAHVTEISEAKGRAVQAQLLAEVLRSWASPPSTKTAWRATTGSR